MRAGRERGQVKEGGCAGAGMYEYTQAESEGEHKGSQQHRAGAQSKHRAGALDGLLPSPEVHQLGFVQTNSEGERRDRRFMATGKAGEEKRGVRGARDED
ncbi:hypothetical protein Q8A67_000846 [Cirrhinus molitorella]|uniref:Uncharacterized protein n=1 Tax=Cirrhinus molitorella TaxID=172907 RepID=A0AA88QDF0_9TELE|nr:hypothetical protein Q8A67_000846 [Cirrhinus molitorella]